MTARATATTLGVALAFTLALSGQSTAPTPQHPATAAGAKAFLDEVNRELLALANAASRAGWTQATYITADTEVIAAQANEALVNAQTRCARQAARFDNVQVAPELRRQLDLLKSALTLAAPPDPKEAEEVTRLVASMESVYGSGKYCPSDPGGPKTGAAPPDPTCLDIEGITRILAESRAGVRE